MEDASWPVQALLLPLRSWHSLHKSTKLALTMQAGAQAMLTISALVGALVFIGAAAGGPPTQALIAAARDFHGTGGILWVKGGILHAQPGTSETSGGHQATMSNSVCAQGWNNIF